MSIDNYYTALGVVETASPSEIKLAYRNLLKKIHPDTVSTLSPSLQRMAADATKEIIEAYSVLSDENKRRRYDQQIGWYGQPSLGGGVTQSAARPRRSRT
jgi:DnaJ-class molecular chaperone